MNLTTNHCFLTPWRILQPLKRCADIHWQPSHNTLEARRRLIPSWITTA